MFFDQWGLLNDQADVTNNSENRSLWTVEYLLLKRLQGSLTQEELSGKLQTLQVLYDGRRWHCLPDHTIMADEGFSRDNMIAITAAGKIFNDAFLAKAGARQFWYLRYAQPQDKIFFAWCAGQKLGTTLLPLLKMQMRYNCKNVSKTRSGTIDCSSLILVFIRVQALDDIGLLNRCAHDISISLREHHGVSVPPNEVWRWVFSQYFQDEINPINLLAQEIWRNKWE